VAVAVVFIVVALAVLVGAVLLLLPIKILPSAAPAAQLHLLVRAHQPGGFIHLLHREPIQHNAKF
jgi:hypothetical protein